MPSKRRRATRNRLPDVCPEHWALLTDAPMPEDHDTFAQFTFDAAALWPLYRYRILADWPAGTRPQAWWLFDAPRLADVGRFASTVWASEMIEPRRKISGVGCPAWEVLCYAPSYRLGIPSNWHGLDPSDPPQFESQMDYLIRHGLATDAERTHSSR